MDHRRLFKAISIFVLLLILGGCSPAEDRKAAVVPFFPGRHGYDLKQFVLEDKNSALEFKRVDCVWVVGPDSLPSDEPRVTALAEALATLAPHLEPAIEPGRFEDFKVDEESFTLRAGLTFKDNSSYTLLIGIPALTKPVYIRSAESSQVYTVDEPLLRQLELDGAAWLTPEG